MTLQADLIKSNEVIAAKRTRLKFLFEDTDKLSEAEGEERVKAIKSANDELATLVDKHEKIQAAYEVEKLERDALKSLRKAPRQIDPAEDMDGSYTGPGSHLKVANPFGGNWGPTVLKAAEEQAAIRGLKSILPSGTAVVPVPVGGPIEIPRRAKFLSELMPVEDAPGGHLSYLRQTVRTNNAAVVEEGGIKPTSVFTLEKIEDTTDVIAHLSEPLPRSYFDDSTKIVQFIEQEMRLGVALAVDAKIVADILAASGLLVEGDIGSTIDTSRRALTRLQEREVEPSAFVLHPRDWEQMELEMTTGFAANSNMPAPTDEVRRSLFGIPVVVSNAIPQNTGLLGDFRDSAALYRTDGVRLDWSEATYDSGVGATDFERNLLRWRAEGRFQTAILRSFAFVSINLAGTGS